MTVKELRDLLKEFENDKEVEIVDNEGYSYELDCISIGYTGTINLMTGEMR